MSLAICSPAKHRSLFCKIDDGCPLPDGTRTKLQTRYKSCVDEHCSQLWMQLDMERALEHPTPNVVEQNNELSRFQDVGE